VSSPRRGSRADDSAIERLKTVACLDQQTSVLIDASAATVDDSITELQRDGLTAECAVPRPSTMDTPRLNRQLLYPAPNRLEDTFQNGLQAESYSGYIQ